MINFKSMIHVLGACVLLLQSVQAYAEQVSVAVAANFTAPFKEIVSQFEANSGHKVAASYGSTGSLYTQVSNGAPFEIFLSADSSTVDKIQSNQLGVNGSDFVYAQGRLVLWSAKPKVLNRSPQALIKNQFSHLAIANPKTAPYGAAAMQVLKNLKLDKPIQSKILTGQSIGQTYQFVATGNAELGFVAMSQISLNGKLTSGSVWVVPAKLYTPIMQKGVLLKNGEKNDAAKELLQYLKSAQAKKVIKKYGYTLPKN